MRKLLLLLMFCGSAMLTAPAFAQFIQQRFLPADAERGTLGPSLPLPAVRIGSRTLRMAPGARIYDRENRTIVHDQLPPGAEIVFSRDQAGDLQRIYILTEQELARQAGRR